MPIDWSPFTSNSKYIKILFVKSHPDIRHVYFLAVRHDWDKTYKTLAPILHSEVIRLLYLSLIANKFFFSFLLSKEIVKKRKKRKEIKKKIQSHCHIRYQSQCLLMTWLSSKNKKRFIFCEVLAFLNLELNLWSPKTSPSVIFALVTSKLVTHFRMNPRSCPDTHVYDLAFLELKESCFGLFDL